MENIQLIEGENAVLVPIKKWERVQNELVRLPKEVNKAKVLDDIRTGIVEIERDLRREPHLREITMTADEFLAELKNRYKVFVFSGFAKSVKKLAKRYSLINQ